MKRKNSTVVVCLFFLILYFFPLLIFPQESDFKYIRNYERREYGEQPQNWAIAQDKRGVLFVANNGSLMEYDGVSWRYHYNSNKSPIRSIALDKTEGRIYAGGFGDFGYFHTGAEVRMEYQSLLSDADKKIDFDDVVSRIIVTEKGVYFWSRSRLFRWQEGALKNWTPKGKDPRFDSPFFWKEDFYIRDRGVGMFRVDGDSLLAVPELDALALYEVYANAPYDERSILLVTREGGCFLFDGLRLTPFPTPLNVYFKDKKIIHGIRLSSRDFAMATQLGGVVIMGRDGQLKQVFDKSQGILVNHVKAVFQDFQGNLWLALDYGLSRLEYDTPFSFYDDRAGLPHIILSVAGHRGALYVGTKSGLYYRDHPDSPFYSIHGVGSTTWYLLSTRDSLLAATGDGVFQVEKEKFKQVTPDKSYVLCLSAMDKNRVWVGTAYGVYSVYRKNRTWRKEFDLQEEMNVSVATMATDSRGDLWIGYYSLPGVMRVSHPADPAKRFVTRFDKSHGLPGNEARVFNVAGHLMFAHNDGILRFDEKNQRFINDDTLGEEFLQKDSFVFHIVEDKKKNIWFTASSKYYHAVPQAGGGYKVHKDPFQGLPNVQVNVIYPQDGTVWLGSNDELIAYNIQYKKDYKKDFQALVRTVSANEKAIYRGNSTNPGSPYPVLAYGDRNLRFQFSAPWFEGETAPQYRYKLQGYDSRWSAWSSDTFSEYTNLGAGEYVFKVKARNISLRESREDIYPFRVLPPWYQTWWAFGGYILFTLLAVYLIVKWRSGALLRDKEKLERVVVARTKEIHSKNNQLEQQTLQLQEQSEKLKEMDRAKSRFFANVSHEFRTPLTLILGPLEKLLSRFREPDIKKELGMMHRSAQRLLILINQLLDLSRLDSGKMKLKALPQDIVSFTKGIVASFQSLASQKKIRFRFRAKQEDISIYFEAERLEAILGNLLTNAFKFTPPGGDIVVFVQPGHEEDSSFPCGYVELSVSDTGTGISREKLPYIFDRFYQTGDSAQQDRKGTGIGLALSKELVLLHHGKIDVHSREGEGTEFVIRLPMGDKHLRKDEKQEKVKPDSGYIKVEDVIRQFDVSEPGLAGFEDLQDGNEKNGKNGKNDKPIVLVVEDNADVRQYVRGPLEPGYRVIEAVNGREGIDRAREVIPDLIVSDIMMPEVDGYQLCRELKTDVKTSHIPIIMLTARASVDSVVEGLETGADDYITKPFNTRILLTRIRNLIRLRGQLQEKIQRQMKLQPVEISVSSMDEQFLKELMELIEKNLSDPEFHVEALSKKLYMNRATLYRKVRALTGETPTEFIRSYRLKRSAQLLREKFGNVSEVALEVGFSNMAYFAKCFKDKFHQLPSAYQAAESA